MADKFSQSTNIEVNLGFIDEDTRKVKVPNAKDDVDYETSDFTGLENALKPTIDGAQVNFVVGDRNGAEFTGILYADIVATSKTEFDLRN